MNDLFVEFAEKRFKKNLNTIQKRIRFSRFSMFDQTQIINYFEFVDQFNFKSLKFKFFINSFCSTFRICFSINQVAKTSQYQYIAIDKIKSFKSIKLIKSFKFAVFINLFNSTSRICFSVNQMTKTSQIAIAISLLFHALQLND